MEKMNRAVHSLVKEFQLSRCCFSEAPPDNFVKSQWQKCTKSWIYLIYRWFIAIFFLTAVIESLLDHVDVNYYFIYMTNWGILLCMITNFLGAILVTVWHFHTEYANHISDSKLMPNSFKIYWILHNTTLISSIIISFVYWTFLFSEKSILSAVNILTHGCNSLLMFIDVLIVAYPVRLLHVFMPLSFGITYVLFTVIYFYAGGVDPRENPYVYEILDWRKPSNAIVTVIGVLFLCCLVHMLIFGVYKLRTLLYMHFYRKDFILPTSSSAAGSTKTQINNYFSSSIINNKTPPIVTLSPKHISMVLGDVGKYNPGFIDGP